MSRGYLRYPHVHGDLLTFVAGHDVWLAPATGGRATRFSSDDVPVSYPRFSRDGTQIAWASCRDGNPEVYLADTEGSAATRLTFWGDPTTRVTGWTTGGEILANTAAGQPAMKYRREFVVPAEGAPRLLPFGPVNDVALEAEGTVLLTASVAGEPAFWKRYRGGRAGKLWTSTAADPPPTSPSPFTRILADVKGQFGSPMLIGGRVFFLSDFEGTGNIYSCALDGGDLARHTDHDGFYARNPATDGTRIVYHVAGEIWMLDSPDAPEPHRIELTLSSPAAARAPRLISAADHLGDLDCDQTGQASVVEVRGTVHWLTHKDGPAPALYVHPDARARLPRVLGPGRAVWITDATGADALAIASVPGPAESDPGSAESDPGSAESDPGSAESDPGSAESDPGSAESDPGSAESDPGSAESGPGSAESGPGSAESGPASAESGPGSAESGPGSAESGPGSAESGPGSAESGPGSAESGPASGGTGPVLLAEGLLGSVVDLEASPDGATVAAAAQDGRLFAVDVSSGQVTELAASDDGPVSGISWSPDSAWLAWSQGGPRPLRRIRVARIADREVIDVTDGRFSDTSPVFTADGLYLAFLSRRSFDPVYDAHSFDLSFPFGIRPYLVPLAARTPSPFGPLLGGRSLTKDSTDDSHDDDSHDDDSETDSDDQAAVVVDADGLADRVVGVPVEEARYFYLSAVKGGLVWLRAPLTGVLGESGADLDDDSPRSSLERFDLRKREVTVLEEELDWFDVSGDGTRLVIGDDDDVRVVPSETKEDRDSDESVTVDMSRARFEADPAALWRHAYAEAGRRMQRDFWVADMSGVDWDGVLDAYRPLVDLIRGSDDFADLLWELFGELGTSHAYVHAPSDGFPDDVPVGLLGADISRDGSGRWIVDRVLPGESSDPRARSPFAAPGVGVRPGDELVAVDGRPVDQVRGPWPLLAGTAGKPVELTVRPSANGSSREVVVVPLRSDRRLRYQDWVASRRRLVRELSDGRLGYLHVPDMMGEGWAHFHRDLRTEMRFDALIFDVRGNSGGHTSQLVVEKVARHVIGWTRGRYLQPRTYPREARRGPVVTLADEFAGSDGDIVTAAVRLLGLGPVVGTRTWGGVIGIEGSYPLVDGTRMTVPKYAFSFDRYGWSVENYGVDPDVEVLNTPDDWAAGRDAQLETAVHLALEELDKQPPPPPPDTSSGPRKPRPPLPARST